MAAEVPASSEAAQSAAPKPEENKQVNKQGYSIGGQQGTANDADQNRQQRPVRRLTLVLLVAAVVFLFIVLVAGSGKRSGIRAERAAFLNAYAAYLATNKDSLGLDPGQRVSEVSLRLQKILVSEETGDYQRARSDLYELMLLDRDAQSPLFKQCAAWLQRLPK